MRLIRTTREFPISIGSSAWSIPPGTNGLWLVHRAHMDHGPIPDWPFGQYAQLATEKNKLPDGLEDLGEWDKSEEHFSDTMRASSLFQSLRKFDPGVEPLLPQ